VLPLLVLASLLLLVSGLVKMKAAARVDLGLPLLALVELLAGVAIIGVAFMQSFTARQGLAVVVGAVVLVVVSSVQVGLAIQRRHRRLADSEGARLANYVRYRSRLDPPAP